MTEESGITDYEQGKIFARQEIKKILDNFFAKLCNDIAKDKKSKLDFFTAEEIAIRVLDFVQKEMEDRYTKPEKIQAGEEK